MSDPQIDPDLLGIWIIPGEPATFEVCSDGSYHIAEAATDFALFRGGRFLQWGNTALERILGDGDRIEGVWRVRESGDEWYFRPDGSYTLHWPDGEEAHGIWAVQEDGTKLWTREELGRIDTTGAEVSFHLHSGPPIRYGYTADAQTWTLMNPETWAVLIEYHRP